MRTINTLVLALVINVMEIPQHFNSRYMGPGVINNALAAMFDEVFNQLQRLVNFPPLARFFFHETRIDTGHDFVEVLKVKCTKQLVSIFSPFRIVTTYPVAISCIKVELAPLPANHQCMDNDSQRGVNLPWIIISGLPHLSLHLANV